jgi:hypothetical protein
MQCSEITRRADDPLAGGLAGLLVLDATRRTSGRERDAVGTHASPITHVRSGHFKRVPVGPREEQRREIRWISPTIVNPDGAGTRMRVSTVCLDRPALQ